MSMYLALFSGNLKFKKKKQKRERRNSTGIKRKELHLTIMNVTKICPYKEENGAFNIRQILFYC